VNWYFNENGIIIITNSDVSVYCVIKLLNELKCHLSVAVMQHIINIIIYLLIQCNTCLEVIAKVKSIALINDLS
jgi:hypothetical protein